MNCEAHSSQVLSTSRRARPFALGAELLKWVPVTQELCSFFKSARPFAFREPFQVQVLFKYCLLTLMHVWDSFKSYPKEFSLQLLRSCACVLIIRSVSNFGCKTRTCSFFFCWPWCSFFFCWHACSCLSMQLACLQFPLPLEQEALVETVSVICLVMFLYLCFAML